MDFLSVLRDLQSRLQRLEDRAVRFRNVDGETQLVTRTAAVGMGGGGTDPDAIHDASELDGAGLVVDGTELAVGEGHGIDVNANDVAVDESELTVPQANVSGLVAALAALQPLDSDLTAIAAVGSQTAYGRAFLALVDAAGARSYLGLGSLAVLSTINGSNWSGQDLAIADGGTGSSTAAGAATNLGLGTGDSPQHTAVNIGHATDTTVSRASAGDIAVEGNQVYRAGGTDVPVTDGGTGASTASGARTNLGLGSVAPLNIGLGLEQSGSDLEVKPDPQGSIFVNSGSGVHISAGAAGNGLSWDATTHALAIDADDIAGDGLDRNSAGGNEFLDVDSTVARRNADNTITGNVIASKATTGSSPVVSGTTSSSGCGVQGVTATGNGVLGSANSSGTGVVGVSSSGKGVGADGGSGMGIDATGATVGVKGYASGAGGSGVQGFAGSGLGPTVGIGGLFREVTSGPAIQIDTAHGTGPAIDINSQGKITNAVAATAAADVPRFDQLPGAGTWHHTHHLNNTGSVAIGTANLGIFSQVQVLSAATLTGIGYYVGTVASGNVRCALYDSTGTRVANKTTDTAQASANTFQQLAFASTYAAPPGVYYVLLIFSSTTATYYGASSFSPSNVAAGPGSTATNTSITPPTTPYAGALVPQMTTY